MGLDDRYVPCHDNTLHKGYIVNYIWRLWSKLNSASNLEQRSSAFTQQFTLNNGVQLSPDS